MIRNYGSKLEPWDTLDDWPGLSVVYLRVPWSFLEPKEGEFNWSLFDTPAIALPLPDGDGQKRYRLGRIRVIEAPSE
jgi:hypothetical protein